MNWHHLALVCVLSTGGTDGTSQDTKPIPLGPPTEMKVEPAPTITAAPVVVSGPDPMYFRKSRYEVWQWYGVNYQGKFLPRVIYAPGGAYYRANGQPFPWAITLETEFMPYLE